MEKRLKYLLGSFIIGLGLLINQSFGIVIEGVTIPLGIEMSYVDFQESSNYRYYFQYKQDTYNGTATPYVRYFGYSLFYDGQTQIDLLSASTYRNCPGKYTTTKFNNSAFGQDLYNGGCAWIGRYSDYTRPFNMPDMNWGTSFDSTQKVILGNASNFGNGFVYVGEGTDPDPSPKFGFGGGYLTNNNFTQLFSNNQLQDYPLRLFYYRNSDSTSPLDGFDIASNSGSNISNFFAWQYFTPQGTVFNVANRNLPATFGDLGGSYAKGTHVSGYGFGYSFFLRKGGLTMTWNDFDFASIGSKCLQTLYIDGTSDPNSQTRQGCQQLGFLVLKGNTYVSYGNTDSVIVVTKDLENHTRLLYQTFNCYEDDIQRIFNSQYCTSIGHGYLTVNGTGDILPFIDSGSTYTLSYEGNGILDYFLYKNNQYLSVSRDSNGFTLGSYTFLFNPTPDSISIKDYYQNGALGYTGTANSSGIPNEGSEISSSSSLYLNCLGPVYNTPDGNPPAYCFDENGVLNPDRFKDCYSTIEQTSDGGAIIHNFCNINGYYQEIVLEQYGSGYAIVPGESTTNILDILNSPGFSEQYFNNYLNTKGYFFKCPFAYDSNLTIWPKLVSMLSVDPNLPINCVIAGYSQGKNFIANQFNLHLLENGPILNGDSSNRKMLFRFVDFILLFGFLFLLIKIFKLFK